jgi:hypothetical protein
MSDKYQIDANWQTFLDELARLTPREIANKRYSGDWGVFDPNDSTKSDPRVREANRYLTELNQRRNLVPVTIGVWTGVIAVFIGSLAMPVRDSVLAQTVGSEQAALRIIQVALASFLIASAYLGWKSFVWTRGLLDFGQTRAKRTLL